MFFIMKPFCIVNPTRVWKIEFCFSVKCANVFCSNPNWLSSRRKHYLIEKKYFSCDGCCDGGAVCACKNCEPRRKKSMIPMSTSLISSIISMTAFLIRLILLFRSCYINLSKPNENSPSTTFGHSDRKKRALTGRHNFVTSILWHYL
jgi:hypothetical protein